MGGVEIPFAKGLKGHSDADAAVHAVIDALLGAAGIGDIGQCFPDSDPQYKGADSIVLLRKTQKIIAPQCRVQHIDVTILAEAPKIGPYKQRMRARIAHALDIKVENVNVKAKTNEGMGFVGKKQGIAAMAVATVYKRSQGTAATVPCRKLI